MLVLVATRGIFVGGGPSLTNRIEFVTIATLGNVQDFGDILLDRLTI